LLSLESYFERVGLDGDDIDLATLQRAQVTSIPYENLDVELGRGIRLDTAGLTAKLVDRKRGGNCFELNSLFAAALETLGYRVTRLLSRVRLESASEPRPETHMVLLVDGSIIDVGFGAATPTGPVPLGGEATHGPWTWRTERIQTPEGEHAWAMWFYDLLLYTFTDVPRHPMDFLMPNHFTSTHPLSPFTRMVIVQRWQDDDSQLGLIDRELTLRRAGCADEVARVDDSQLDAVLRDRFGLELPPASEYLLPKG
jgi:N-hydroxyarylamine O-acetyltransferase